MPATAMTLCDTMELAAKSRKSGWRSVIVIMTATVQATFAELLGTYAVTAKHFGVETLSVIPIAPSTADLAQLAKTMTIQKNHCAYIDQAIAMWKKRNLEQDLRDAAQAKAPMVVLV